MNASYRLGLAAVLSASLCTSTGGLLVRLIEDADAWQVLFYRSLFFCLAIFGFLVWRHGPGTAAAFRAVGKPGLIVAIALAVAFVSYIQALYVASVAKVVFIISCSPFFAALFAWLVLREAVRPGFWLALGAALSGIAIMAGASLLAGESWGAFVAFGSCLGYAATLVAFRAGRGVDMLPACCLAGLITLAASAAMAPGLAISAHDLAIAALLGVFQLALQYILLTLGSRSVPAAEIALLGRLQLVLAPLWVWLFIDEVPATTTLIGGAIVAAAVFGHALQGLKAERS
ncbi:MAG: DMT family transporter [Pseudomonadota bacterium]